MSTITTHVLDTALGKPAAGVSVVLQRVEQGGQPMQIGAGVTDSEGRLKNLLVGKKLDSGDYRLRFLTGAYFARDGRESFYPVVVVEFSIKETDAHYHVPLLLSPYGYSTYRGS